MDNSLLMRNVSEVVSEEEFDALVESKKKPVVYCGYEVSGPVHIGSMVTVVKLLDFLEAGFKVKVLLADLHTQLNIKDVDVDEMVSYWTKTFKALGLSGAEYVRGSDFQYGREYVEDVLKIASASTLNRALRSMQEIARDIEHARVSQVIYPLMQIADVKHLGVDIAYGGLEQRKIHMLAREILPEVGYKKPVCVHTPLLVSLSGPESKMSSSRPETMVRAQDSQEEIKKKISKAFCPPEKDGNPILGICELVLLPLLSELKVKRPEKFGGDVDYASYTELEKDYLAKKLHPADLKAAAADALVGVLEPVRENK